MNKPASIFSIALLAFGIVFFAACNSVRSENAGSETAETAEAEPANETVKITISRRGYEPKSIAAKKGQPVKLIFYREDGENCGDELVFPKLNVKRKLAVGAVETIEFTPPEAGEIKFTCGMNMLRGKVIVSD